MSEYYRIRRSQITDLTGLIFFVIGWIGSAPFAWPYIKAGFDTGSPTTGIFRFAIVVFGAGIGLGFLGMAAGAIGGRLWEARHRGKRNGRDEMRPATIPGALRTSPKPKPKAPRAALPPLRFEIGTPSIDAYTKLASQFGEIAFEPTRAEAAIARSLNICAWDGDDLAGIARVVGDGYFFAALAEILVAPALQHRGLGRELLNRSLERTPRGVLFIGAPFGNSAFFDAAGCERGLTGFTMRRPAPPLED